LAHESGALRTKDLARVTVDTTVQPKDITFPTDGKLLHAAIKGLPEISARRSSQLAAEALAPNGSRSERSCGCWKKLSDWLVRELWLVKPLDYWRKIGGFVLHFHNYRLQRFLLQ
jgi:hypothetical protein